MSTAVNGKEALELLKENENIDLVITDYVMPEMNGIELCRVIRNDITLNHLPIVMLTAKTQAEYHLEGYDAGADAYITKPVEIHWMFRNWACPYLTGNFWIELFQ